MRPNVSFHWVSGLHLSVDFSLCDLCSSCHCLKWQPASLVYHDSDITHRNTDWSGTRRPLPGCWWRGCSGPWSPASSYPGPPGLSAAWWPAPPWSCSVWSSRPWPGHCRNVCKDLRPFATNAWCRRTDSSWCREAPIVLKVKTGWETYKYSHNEKIERGDRKPVSMSRSGGGCDVSGVSPMRLT